MDKVLLLTLGMNMELIGAIVRLEGNTLIGLNASPNHKQFLSNQTKRRKSKFLMEHDVCT